MCDSNTHKEFYCYCLRETFEECECNEKCCTRHWNRIREQQALERQQRAPA